MDIRIVPMQSDADKDGKGYVHYQSWMETYTGLIDQEYLNNRSLEKCVETAHRYPQNTLVAKDGENVVGFVCYGAYRDDSLKDTGEIYAIYVLRAYQGKQVGYRLMNAALEQLRMYPHIALWVLKGNERALRFYERYGFNLDGAEAQIRIGTELRMRLAKS